MIPTQIQVILLIISIASAIMFLILILSLFVPLTSCAMMATQFRHFWPSPFIDKDDYIKYLASEDKLMSFTNVQESNRVFYVDVQNYESVLSLPDALQLLLKKDSHTLIIYFYTSGQLEKGFRVYAGLNKTPQIWTYFSMAQGPSGREVPMNEARAVAYMNKFTGNRILALGWTITENYKEYKDMKYNESHFQNMSGSLQINRPNMHIVIIFDALLLSHTPEVLEWLPDNLANMPVMIKLADYGMEKFVNVDNLRNFVRATKMWPFFFDVPEDIHKQLIGEEAKFTTIYDNTDKNGGPERRLGTFRVLVGVVSLLCMSVFG